MGVSSFPPATGGGGGGLSAPFYNYAPSGNEFITLSGVAGIYTIRAWEKDFGASPTGAIEFFDNTNQIIVSAILRDPDSGSSKNQSEVIVRVTSDFKGLGVNFTTPAWVSVEFNNVYSESNPLVVTTYSTSQTVTIASDNTPFCLMGGGGGGASNTVGASGGSGGGGGSGYKVVGSVIAGDFSLVVGSGGAQDTTGGSSTFNGLSAGGGVEGLLAVAAYGSGDGGDGGSGGGGGNSVGGFGGGNGSGAVGGTGSGELAPGYTGPQASTTSVGSAGGVYAGGGGGDYASGGGGGGALAGSGQTGGAGGLFILTGL